MSSPITAIPNRQRASRHKKGAHIAWPRRPVDAQALLALFLGGLDVHVGHLLTVRVFNEALGLTRRLD